MNVFSKSRNRRTKRSSESAPLSQPLLAQALRQLRRSLIFEALGVFHNSQQMITLNVFVRVKPEHREELLAAGHTLFDALAKEPTFIDAWINAAVDQSDLVVVYERWNETKESFVQNILPKPFYAPYLALLERVGLGREAFWLEERGSWRAETSTHPQ